MALQTIQLPAPPRGFGTSEADIVVDSARVLSPDAISLINRIAFDVHAKSGGEIAVVTLRDIGDRAESDVALQIGRQWGVGAASAIGQRTRNAGAVILLVPKETSADGQGKCWVSTGRGVEGFITDADAGSICREAAQSFFRQRDYSSGVALVALRTAQEFAREFNFTLDTALAAPQLAPRYSDDDRYGGGGGFSPFALIAIVVIVWIVLSSLRGGRRGGCGGCLPIFIPMGGGGGPYYRGGGGGWGGGGFGGGGGGFGGFGGGGGFSGGGGGSRW